MNYRQLAIAIMLLALAIASASCQFVSAATITQNATDMTSTYILTIVCAAAGLFLGLLVSFMKGYITIDWLDE